jgi:hypothetical protein
LKRKRRRAQQHRSEHRSKQNGNQCRPYMLQYRHDGLMRDLAAGVFALIAAGAGVVWIILVFWLLHGTYRYVDRRDPNSAWLIISSRYRRLLIAIVTLYAVTVTAMILSAILAKLLR